MMYPTGVNPKTRLPFPPPVRPLPIGERGSSSPVPAGENTLLLSKVSDQVVFSSEHNGHTLPSNDRVGEHDNIDAALHQLLTSASISPNERKVRFHGKLVASFNSYFFRQKARFQPLIDQQLLFQILR